jgi:hypothetical protein
MRSVHGELFAFGPSTMASKESLTVDTGQLVNVDRYFDGPIVAKASSRPLCFRGHSGHQTSSSQRGLNAQTDRVWALVH